MKLTPKRADLPSFNRLPAMLQYLSKHSTGMEALDNIEPLSIEELTAMQTDWLSLVSKLNHPLDIEFFQPSWVPIKKDSLTYFIDLSSPTMPLFHARHIQTEPYFRYKELIVHDFNQFLIDLDDNRFDPIDYCKGIQAENEATEKAMYDKAYALGFRGKLPVRNVEDDELLLVKGYSTYTLIGNMLIVSGTKPEIVGLLPLDMEISFDRCCAMFNTAMHVTEMIHSVCGLVYFIQSSATKHVDSYIISFASEGEAVLENDTFILTHSDPGVLKSLIERIERLLR